MVLEVTGLKKHFGGIYVTNDLDLDIAKGAREAIIGPNGAGKSTFFNLLTGYHRPEAGTVVFDGVDITNWESHRIARAGISRAFQISNIFTSLTVFENVRTAVHARMGKARSIFVRADRIGTRETEAILERCHLVGKASHIAGEMAQGDKKKLELAIALAGQPKLLLLDEPTAGMSLEETQETMTLVDKLNEELGLSVLFTEHDMSVVFNHAERVSLLHRGEIIVRGTPEEVRRDETARRVYLGEEH
jgi:branched-chain amino acid transport system ATP-binding protein